MLTSLFEIFGVFVPECLHCLDVCVFDLCSFLWFKQSCSMCAVNTFTSTRKLLQYFFPIYMFEVCKECNGVIFLRFEAVVAQKPKKCESGDASKFPNLPT